MRIAPTNDAVTKVKADAVVVGLFAGERPTGAAGEVDQASGGLITRLIDAKEISGKAGEVLVLHAPQGIASPVLVIVGLGKQSEFDCSAMFRAAGAAAKQLAGKARGHVAMFLDRGQSPELTQHGVAGAMVGCVGQDLHRAERKRHAFERLSWAGGNNGDVAAGQIIGESVNLARRLVNEPPSVIYPESFAAGAVEMAGECGLEIEVWDEQRLRDERCGSLLAVAQGSQHPPRMVIFRHRGSASPQPELALVGKGVTFDSGGLSLKPSESMLAMKCDMAGGAAVVGAMHGIARLKQPVHAIGLVGLVENMPSGTAMKLGDVLTARSGTTIEVHNTDAEGRLVLADVLAVAVEQQPKRIVDLATLTGACMVALGLDVAGLFSNNQQCCDAVAAAANYCGEPVWQMPMFAEYYDELITSEVADIKNVGQGRWGGSITAAKFLERFVGDVPWTHIDIAGPAFQEKPKPWIDAGGSGVMVRTLIELARRSATSTEV